MKRTPRSTGRQLGLFLEPRINHQPAEETREALIEALAELLLEAYGEDPGEEHKTAGGRDESEDHR